jgi:chromosome segregation ATPase
LATAQQRRWLVTIIAIVACAGALGRVSGQAPRSAVAPAAEGRSGASDDVLPALLAEVKGLRAAMEQMASAGPRVQLSVSRLQLQEGRIAAMVRRLDTVRDTLTTARRDLDRAKGAMKMLESGEPHPGGPPAEEVGSIVAGLKLEISTAQTNVDRLSAEETQLTQDVTTEQARWVEINQRLDELERSLARR